MESAKLFEKIFKEKLILNSSKLHFVSSIMSCFRDIPYENISKINLSKPTLRTPDIIMHDFEKFGLGGTCFSLTWFLKIMLNYFGEEFDVYLADRTYGENTHCAGVWTDLNGDKYLLDVGYLIFTPVLIPQNEKESEFSFGSFDFKIVNSNSRLQVYSKTKNADYKFRYVIKMDKISDSDFMDIWNSEQYIQLRKDHSLARFEALNKKGIECEWCKKNRYGNNEYLFENDEVPISLDDYIKKVIAK